MESPEHDSCSLPVSVLREIRIDGTLFWVPSPVETQWGHMLYSEYLNCSVPLVEFLAPGYLTGSLPLFLNATSRSCYFSTSLNWAVIDHGVALLYGSVV